MRIQFRSKPTKKDADNNHVRVVNKFLLFPKVLNKELRWLERTEWFQFVDRKAHYCGSWVVDFTYYWKDLCWCDDVPMEY